MREQLFALSSYFGALIARYTANTENIIFGIHTAKAGCNPPLVANVDVTCINRIYAKLITNPIARFTPIPPRTFRLDNATPISVKINEAKGIDVRIYFSTL